MAKNAYLHPAASLVSTDSIPCRSVPEGLGSKPATPSFLIRMLLDAIGEVVLGCLEGLPMGVKPNIVKTSPQIIDKHSRP